MQVAFIKLFSLLPTYIVHLLKRHSIFPTISRIYLTRGQYVEITISLRGSKFLAPTGIDEGRKMLLTMAGISASARKRRPIFWRNAIYADVRAAFCILRSQKAPLLSKAFAVLLEKLGSEGHSDRSADLRLNGLCVHQN
jgi:hypothetical protein